MNGAFVSQAYRERPPESLALAPYPDAPNVGAYFDARRATVSLETSNDPYENADALCHYVFHRHPDSLNLASELTYRYTQAAEYMSARPNGSNILNERFLSYFQGVHDRLMSGYVAMSTPTIISADNNRPQSEWVEGESCQRVYLPDTVRDRSLTWNKWAQQLIKDGKTEELFTGEFYRHGAKVAAGALLPVGNLWIEVGEGLARVRTRLHRSLEVESQWNLPTDGEWGSGLDFWFVMSHIVEKGILELSESIRPGMVDGMKLTPEVYVQSYKHVVDLIRLNPHLDIKGILSDGSWIYSHELTDVFPNQHVSRLHDIAGKVVELGPATLVGLPAQVKFATLNPVRQAAYETGGYKVGVAARFIDLKTMTKVLETFDVGD